MTETTAFEAPADATEGMRKLLLAADKGRADVVPALVGALTDAERRACVAPLKQRRSAVRDDWGGTRWQRQGAVRVAGAGCCTGAAAAAQWLANRDLRSWDVDPSLFVQAFADRDAAWIGDVAHRLANRPSVAEEEYALIAALVRHSGCAVPTTDGFVLGWVRSGAWTRNHGRTPPPLVDRLRDDPFLPVLTPRLFEAADIGSVFDMIWHDDPRDPTTWPGALALLADEKVISRETLLDGCLSRLLRGDRQGSIRGFVKVLEALEPTEDEHAARVVTWVRMLPDAHSAVAGRAQQVLGALDAAGRLETEHLVEASQAVLFRPEKKLVRGQLVLLDKAVRRDRSRAGELLLAAAEAFGHEDHALQERALALVARHLKHAGDAVLPELAASARLLGAGLRARAAEVLGTDVAGGADTAPEAEILPPAPVPEPLDPAVPSLEELAEEVGVLIRSEGSVAEFERALNGLVVHAFHDVDGLARALEPVLSRYAYLRDNTLRFQRNVHGLGTVVSAVLGVATGRPSFSGLREARAEIARDLCHRSVLRAVIDTRLAEAAQRIISQRPPFLLATPTWSTGAIDPAVLVERLRVYEASDIRPGQADFDQALLRVSGRAGPHVMEAAGRLTSPPGRRLAAWLAQGGLAAPLSVGVTEDEAPEPRNTWDRPRRNRRVLVRTEALADPDGFPEPFRTLLSPFDPFERKCRHWHSVAAPAHSIAVLPWHREATAALMLPSLASTADEDGRTDPALLPALAESGGLAGPAVHLALAYGLGARHSEDRLSAVDALLVLAARGQLDAAGLGRVSADLVRLGALKPQRLADSLQEAARTGAHTTTWAVLAAAVPGLLEGAEGKAPRGLSAVLTLAADCAERSAARGGIPQVTAVAGRGGSSQLVKQAKRLRDQLAGS